MWSLACVCVCVVWVCVAGDVVVHKCCGRDQQLTYSQGNFVCQSLGNDTNRNSTRTGLWWFPREAVDSQGNALLTPGGVQFSTMPDCEMSSMDVLMDGEYSMHAIGGKLHLNVLKEAAVHDPDIPRNDSFPPSSYCVDTMQGMGTLVILCPCSLVPCIRTCCQDFYAFDRKTGTCEPVPGDTLNGREFKAWVPSVNDDSALYYRLEKRFPKCKSTTFHEVMQVENESMVLLLPNGSLKSLEGSDEIFRRDEYCVVYNSLNHEMIIFCMVVDMEAVAKNIAYGVMFIIGAFCLFLTVIVTLVLPEMRRNIHGKMAVAHNVMLCIGYLVTGVSQLNASIFSKTSCVVTSLMQQFTILAAFFWLNVMCIDIAWTFSGLRPIQGTAMQRDRKKFIYYSLYAWGSTALISMATIIVEYCPNNSKLKPNFGTFICFFNNRWAELLFFFGPMALLLMANLILFAYTAFKIISVKKETSILSTGDSCTSSKNKQTLILYVKLFCLMGITWVTEVVSWAVGGPRYYWYFTDTVNLLRAVFIFVIFCCKRTVFNMLRDRVLQWLGKEPIGRGASRATRNLSNSSCTTRTTAAYSTTPSARRKFSANQAGEEGAEELELRTVTARREGSVRDSNL